MVGDRAVGERYAIIDAEVVSAFRPVRPFRDRLVHVAPPVVEISHRRLSIVVHPRAIWNSFELARLDVLALHDDDFPPGGFRARFSDESFERQRIVVSVPFNEKAPLIDAGDLGKVMHDGY